MLCVLHHIGDDDGSGSGFTHGTRREALAGILKVGMLTRVAEGRRQEWLWQERGEG